MPTGVVTSETAPGTPAIGVREKTSFWYSLRWMVVIAFLLRLGAIILLHTYRYRVAEGHFDFGYEMGHLARSIALGQGFSNPFQVATGPTAWEPPVYQYLAAGIFRIFGIYTNTSAFVLLTINSIFSALTCIPIYLIAKRTFDQKVALWSAWVWALLPYTMYWSTKWVWETALSALLLALLFLITLTISEDSKWSRWLLLGLLWGIGALVNPSLLSFLPVSLIWLAYERRADLPRFTAQTTVAILLLGAVLTPWTVRNYEVFGKFILVRDNFPAELRMGNDPHANGTWMWWLHPTLNVLEMRKFQQLGEISYIAQRKQEALSFIAANPGTFLKLCLFRFIYYWGGLPRASEIPALAPLKNSLFLASSVLAI